MNIIPSSRVFSALLATLTASIFASDLHAGASNKNGNPFGNGSFFSNNGTFSAVVRGENLSGTIYFSTGADSNAASTTSSGGSSEIVYQGNTYTGNSEAAWSPSSGSISGQLNGGQFLSGTNTSTSLAPGQTIITNISYTTYTNVGINFVTGAPYTNTYDVAQTNTTVVKEVGTTKFNDTLYMSGNFMGNVNNSYPNQTFSAYGNVVQQQINTKAADGTVALDSVTVPIAVSGIRISDEITSFATVSNSVPYITTSYQTTNY